MDITNLVKIILLLLSFIYTAFLVPYLKTKLNEAEQDRLRKAVVRGVRAAEMLFDVGADKYEFVANYLAEQGFKLDVEEVKVLIESAVLELKKNLE